jgi:Zn-dependent protease
MDQDIQLGKIAGIPIGINWSIIFIFILFAWEVSDLVLPTYHPHNSTGLYWAVGIATTVVFFASLLMHEVSHAVVARHNGVGVRRITLWLFGGVSELESEALTPGADFRIAVVGPVTSLVIAGVFGAIALSFHQGRGAEGVVIAAIGWLAWMNLLLGVFNLIPGAPLDGGRVLRALVWRRSGDRAHAATVATQSGEVFGYLFIVVGVLEFVTVSIFGLWLVFMGWFLLIAARTEQSSVVMRSSLANVRVDDVMTAHPTTFDPTMTVADLVDHELYRLHFGTFPLVEADGTLFGLTTVARVRHVPPDRRASTRLIDVAVPLRDVPVGSPGTPVVDLLARMQSSPDGRALVTDEKGQLVGVVSPTDVARYVQWCMLQTQGRAPRARSSH